MNKKITLIYPVEMNSFNEFSYDTKEIRIIFNNDTSHYGVIYQFISGLVKKGFASQKEIIDETITNLLSIKNNKLYIKSLNKLKK
jgi:methyl coenzyme M reductase subunit C